MYLYKAGGDRMDYESAIAYLNKFINFERLPEPRLETRTEDIDRFRNLLNEMGNPHQKFAVIHVAGTKGKGSTAAMLASILRCAGYRVGLYTSPHLETVRERIRVNGRIISKPELASLIDNIANVVSRIGEPRNLAFRTVFEFLTAAAFMHFVRRRVQIAIIEAGLGGRLDATIVVNPILSILTPIGLDHVQVLGSTITAIATDKSCIIKPYVPVVSAPQPAEAIPVIKARAGEVHAPLTFAPGAEAETTNPTITFEQIRLRLNRRWIGSNKLTMSLTGRYQLENLSTVLTAVDVLNATKYKISADAVRRGLRTTRWPGRMMQVEKIPHLILDGAHNDLAIKALVASLLEIHPGPYRVIISALKGKPLDKMIKELAPYTVRFYLAPLCFPKGFTKRELDELATEQKVSYVLCDDVPSAIALALQDHQPDDRVLGTGSLYLVGEAMRWLNNEPPPPADGSIDSQL